VNGHAGGVTPRYRIVPIAEEHIESFREALDGVAREKRYLFFLEAPPLEHMKAFVGGNISKGNPQYVALEGDRVVAWCDILPVFPATRAHCGTLGIGVIAARRGRGIGTALLTATLERAQAIGLKRVELAVREGNPRAASLYERLGFVHEGVQKSAVKVDGEYEDLLLMARLFS
jgi:RimJ/RimL family protein N-acetyltransferase